MTEQKQQPGTDIEAILPPGALEKIRTGQVVKWEDLAAMLAAPPSLPVPAKAPLPTPFTPEEEKALDRLVEIFNSVVPTEAREILPEEASKLIDEREVLDTIVKMGSARKEAIRTTFLNHVDKLVEEGKIPRSDLEVDVDGIPLRDKDGHYMVKATLEPDDRSLGKKLSAEPRKGKTDLDLDILQGIADNEDDGRATHQDYLDVTTPVRVLDYNKLMIKLREKPSFIAAVAAATKTAPGSITVAARKL